MRLLRITLCNVYSTFRGDCEEIWISLDNSETESHSMIARIVVLCIMYMNINTDIDSMIARIVVLCIMYMNINTHIDDPNTHLKHGLVLYNHYLGILHTAICTVSSSSVPQTRHFI
jgi:hypothetical protein